MLLAQSKYEMLFCWSCLRIDRHISKIKYNICFCFTIFESVVSILPFSQRVEEKILKIAFASTKYLDCLARPDLTFVKAIIKFLLINLFTIDNKACVNHDCRKNWSNVMIARSYMIDRLFMSKSYIITCSTNRIFLLC